MLQALVDHEYKLMNVFVGRPVCYDACILASFTVFAKGEVGHLVLDRKQCIDGVDVPIVILRDPAYVSFAGLSLTQEQRQLNYQLIRPQVVVECVLGQFEGCRRSLMKRYDTDVSFTPTLVSACSILHNLCEVHSDNFDDD